MCGEEGWRHSDAGQIASDRISEEVRCIDDLRADDSDGFKVHIQRFVQDSKHAGRADIKLRRDPLPASQSDLQGCDVGDPRTSRATGQLKKARLLQYGFGVCANMRILNVVLRNQAGDS